METRQKTSSIDSGAKILHAVGFLQLGAVIKEIAANDNSDDDAPPSAAAPVLRFPRQECPEDEGDDRGGGRTRKRPFVNSLSAPFAKAFGQRGVDVAAKPLRRKGNLDVAFDRGGKHAFEGANAKAMARWRLHFRASTFDPSQRERPLAVGLRRLAPLDVNPALAI